MLVGLSDGSPTCDDNARSTGRQVADVDVERLRAPQPVQRQQCDEGAVSELVGRQYDGAGPEVFCPWCRRRRMQNNANMRYRVLVVGLLVALTACGGEDGASTGQTVPEEVAVTEPTTNEEAETTEPPETTEPAQTATTTTIPPWTTVPGPPPPQAVLSDDLGGPREIDTICLEWDVVGFMTDYAAEGEIGAAFAVMGMTVVEGDCDIVFQVEATGSRTSAKYIAPDGATVTCWTGEQVTGEITLATADAELSTWPIFVDEEPWRTQRRTCPSEGAPISQSFLLPTTAGIALAEAFGAVGAAVADVYLSLPAAHSEAWMTGAATGAGAVVSAALLDPDQRISWAAERTAGWWARHTWSSNDGYPELWSVIPRLIWYRSQLSEEDVSDWGYGTEAEETLSRLFFGTPVVPEGFDPGQPSEWWALWEANPVPPDV